MFSFAVISKTPDHMGTSTSLNSIPVESGMSDDPRMNMSAGDVNAG